MLKDMDCQRVPVEGNGHGDGGSFLHRLVMRLYGGGGEQAQDAQDVLQEAVLPTGHLSAPSTEQAPAAPQKKAGHSVNTPTNSLLYALWSEWNDIQVGVNAFDYVLNLPLEDGRNGRQLLNDEESKTALTQIKLKLMNLAKQRFWERGADAQTTMDALPCVFLSENKMVAWLFLFPPTGGGKPASLDHLEHSVCEAGVLFGIDHERLQQLADSPEYFQLSVVAYGLAPIPGDDGRIVELVPREPPQTAPQEGAQGLVDYRSSSYTNIIHEGDVICDIIPPSPGTSGVDIAGNVFQSRAGQTPHVPQGQNTGVSEDGQHLVALTSGNLIFEQGVFRIRPTLVVEKNVDYSTGNLDFVGDIIIRGDICAGFSVHTTGTVTVDGAVEGAIVEAGGDIIITKGVLGDNSAMIKSGRTVRAAYLENCVVYAGTAILADCAINAQLYSDGAIRIVSGRGTVIGGLLTAVDRVDVNVIGARSGVLTEIALGQRSFALIEATDLERSLEQMKKEHKELERSLEYLEQQEPSKEISAKISNFRLRYATTGLKLDAMRRRLKLLREERFDLSQCRLCCQVVYPKAKISIGSDTITVSDLETQCNVHLSKKGIQLR